MGQYERAKRLVQLEDNIKELESIIAALEDHYSLFKFNITAKGQVLVGFRGFWQPYEVTQSVLRSVLLFALEKKLEELKQDRKKLLQPFWKFWGKTTGGGDGTK